MIEELTYKLGQAALLLTMLYEEMLRRKLCKFCRRKEIRSMQEFEDYVDEEHDDVLKDAKAIFSGWLARSGISAGSERDRCSKRGIGR